MNADKDIFVFGSNAVGIHGAGAAAWAKRFYGAQYGIGEGLTGQCYAFPTKHDTVRSFSIQEFETSLKRFQLFAFDHPDLTFWMTKVGCGLAGFDEDLIRNLFFSMSWPENVIFPGTWLKAKNPSLCRLIVAGSRDYSDSDTMFADIKKYIEWRYKAALKDIPKEHFMIVEGGALGADILGRKFAIENDLPYKTFPAQWDRFSVHMAGGRKNPAGYVRNNLMAIWSTDLLAFWKNQSRGTKNMIDTAGREGLKVIVKEIQS